MLLVTAGKEVEWTLFFLDNVTNWYLFFLFTWRDCWPPLALKNRHLPVFLSIYGFASHWPLTRWQTEQLRSCWLVIGRPSPPTRKLPAKETRRQCPRRWRGCLRWRLMVLNTIMDTDTTMRYSRSEHAIPPTAFATADWNTLHGRPRRSH